MSEKHLPITDLEFDYGVPASAIVCERKDQLADLRSKTRRSGTTPKNKRNSTSEEELVIHDVKVMVPKVYWNYGGETASCVSHGRKENAGIRTAS